MTRSHWAQLQRAYKLADNALHELNDEEISKIPSVYATEAINALWQLLERTEVVHDGQSRTET